MPIELLQNVEWDEVGEPVAGIPAPRVEPAATGPSSFLPHGSHPGCSLTPGFLNLIGIAPVAVVVVDPQGYFIYGNQEAESLLGYTLIELTSRHILDVVDAEATWVISEFEQLNLQQYWSGRALLRRPQGDPIRVAVNAFSNLLPKGGAEHVALLHPTFPDGPAIVRLPDAAALYGLTAHDIRLLQLLAEGFADKELAALLGVSVWTINKNVGAVLRKLHASSRTEACITAVRAHVVV